MLNHWVKEHLLKVIWKRILQEIWKLKVPTSILNKDYGRVLAKVKKYYNILMDLSRNQPPEVFFEKRYS